MKYINKIGLIDILSLQNKQTNKQVFLLTKMTNNIL